MIKYLGSNEGSSLIKFNKENEELKVLNNTSSMIDWLWIADEDGKVFIYYASSDTRMHVATSTVDKLVDYCMNTPVDGLSSSASVETLKKLIDKNLKLNIKY